MTQLYSIPPWAAAWGFSMLIAILSDKLRHRFAFTIIPMLIAMAGFGILLNVHGVENRKVQYGALFMVTCGCYSAMPVVVCWFVMNLGGHRRRGVGTAWQIGFGNGELSHIPITLTTRYLYTANTSTDTRSWGHYRHVCVPEEGRAVVPQWLHHQCILPQLFGGMLHLVFCGHLDGESTTGPGRGQRGDA